MEKCKCGCRQVVKEGNRFIKGHNTRINNPMNNPNSIEKIKQKTIERYKDRKYSNKHKKACKDYYKTHQHHLTGKSKPDTQIKITFGKSPILLQAKTKR